MTTKISPEQPKIEEVWDRVESSMPSTESNTDREVDDSARQLVAAMFARALAEQNSGLYEDLLLSVEIRKRDAADTGERIALEDFMIEQGYDPADFTDDPSSSSSA